MPSDSATCREMPEPAAARRLPWDFVPTTDQPGPGLVPNAPCEVGAAFGAELARFADQEYATTGRDARCLDCAFRNGTVPNQTAATLANAFKCLYEGEELFMCHVNRGVCEGFLMLKRAGEADDGL